MRIAMIAHDKRKPEMVRWAHRHRVALGEHDLVATATTGHLLADSLGLRIHCYRSGPMGGDQQIGARIAEGTVDLLVFLWDPFEPQPHDPDVKALLRVAVACNVLVACTVATADCLLASPLVADTVSRDEPVELSRQRHDRSPSPADMF